MIEQEMIKIRDRSRKDDALPLQAVEVMEAQVRAEEVEFCQEHLGPSLPAGQALQPAGLTTLHHLWNPANALIAAAILLA